MKLSDLLYNKNPVDGTEGGVLVDFARLSAQFRAELQRGDGDENDVETDAFLMELDGIHSVLTLFHALAQRLERHYEAQNAPTTSVEYGSGYNLVKLNTRKITDKNGYFQEQTTAVMQLLRKRISMILDRALQGWDVASGVPRTNPRRIQVLEFFNNKLGEILGLDDDNNVVLDGVVANTLVSHIFADLVEWRLDVVKQLDQVHFNQAREDVLYNYHHLYTSYVAIYNEIAVLYHEIKQGNQEIFADEQQLKTTVESLYEKLESWMAAYNELIDGDDHKGLPAHVDYYATDGQKKTLSIQQLITGFPPSRVEQYPSGFDRLEGFPIDEFGNNRENTGMRSLALYLYLIEIHYFTYKLELHQEQLNEYDAKLTEIYGEIEKLQQKVLEVQALISAQDALDDADKIDLSAVQKELATAIGELKTQYVEFERVRATVNETLVDCLRRYREYEALKIKTADEDSLPNSIVKSCHHINDKIDEFFRDFKIQRDNFEESDALYRQVSTEFQTLVAEAERVAGIERAAEVNVDANDDGKNNVDDAAMVVDEVVNQVIEEAAAPQRLFTKDQLEALHALSINLEPNVRPADQFSSLRQGREVISGAIEPSATVVDLEVMTKCLERLKTHLQRATSAYQEIIETRLRKRSRKVPNNLDIAIAEVALIFKGQLEVLSQQVDQLSKEDAKSLYYPSQLLHDYSGTLAFIYQSAKNILVKSQNFLLGEAFPALDGDDDRAAEREEIMQTFGVDGNYQYQQSPIQQSLTGITVGERRLGLDKFATDQDADGNLIHYRATYERVSHVFDGRNVTVRPDDFAPQALLIEAHQALREQLEQLEQVEQLKQQQPALQQQQAAPQQQQQAAPQANANAEVQLHQDLRLGGLNADDAIVVDDDDGAVLGGGGGADAEAEADAAQKSKKQLKAERKAAEQKQKDEQKAAKKREKNEQKTPKKDKKQENRWFNRDKKINDGEQAGVDVDLSDAEDAGANLEHLLADLQNGDDDVPPPPASGSEKGDDDVPPPPADEFDNESDHEQRAGQLSREHSERSIGSQGEDAALLSRQNSERSIGSQRDDAAGLSGDEGDMDEAAKQQQLRADTLKRRLNSGNKAGKADSPQTSQEQGDGKPKKLTRLWDTLRGKTTRDKTGSPVLDNDYAGTPPAAGQSSTANVMSKIGVAATPVDANGEGAPNGDAPSKRLTQRFDRTRRSSQKPDFTVAQRAGGDANDVVAGDGNAVLGGEQEPLQQPQGELEIMAMLDADANRDDQPKPLM